MKIIDNCKKLLTWWELGCIDADVVRNWADREIEMAPNGSHLPDWLIDLSMKGPKEFLKTSEPGYPRPSHLSYIEQFRAMVETTDPKDDASIKRFANWVARSCMGEDLKLEPVRIGYEIDHAMEYQNSGDPMQLARDAIASQSSNCRDITNVLGRNWRLIK